MPALKVIAMGNFISETTELYLPRWHWVTLVKAERTYHRERFQYSTGRRQPLGANVEASCHVT